MKPATVELIVGSAIATGIAVVFIALFYLIFGSRAASTVEYSAEWHTQEVGSYNLSIILKPDSSCRSFKQRVAYLSEVLDDALANFVGNFGYRLHVVVGEQTRSIHDYGPFTACRIVLMLIDIGLNEVFKHRLVEIEMYYVY